jgi:hypothetical protein
MLPRLVPGSAVRHDKREEWGQGVVVSIDGRHCVVRFGSDDKTFDLSRAVTFLRATGQTVPLPPRAKVKKTASPCDHCSEPLDAIIVRDEGRWRSCPKCSQADGNEHVLRRSPDAFGMTKATKGKPEAVQAQCEACRTKQPHRDDGRSCTSFAS